MLDSAFTADTERIVTWQILDDDAGGGDMPVIFTIS
jgi:hypothetical protein